MGKNHPKPRSWMADSKHFMRWLLNTASFCISSRRNGLSISVLVANVIDRIHRTEDRVKDAKHLFKRREH